MRSLDLEKGDVAHVEEGGHACYIHVVEASQVEGRVA